MASDRRIIKTKKAIKSAFIDLILANRSMNNISVTKLVDAADISRGTFYLHYTDLYELLEDIENDLLEDFKSAINSHEAESLQNSLLPFIREIIKFIRANNELLSVLVTDKLDMSFTFKIKEITKEKCFENWKKMNYTEPTKMHEYYYSFIFAGTVDLIIEWFQGEIKEDDDTMAQLIEKMIIEGIDVLEA